MIPFGASSKNRLREPRKSPGPRGIFLNPEKCQIFNIWVCRFNPPGSGGRWWALLRIYLYNKVLGTGLMGSHMDSGLPLARSRSVFRTKYSLSGPNTPGLADFVGHKDLRRIGDVESEITRELLDPFCPPGTLWGALGAHGALWDGALGGPWAPPISPHCSVVVGQPYLCITGTK